MSHQSPVQVHLITQVHTFGLKGAHAEAKLKALGITVPSAPNRWSTHEEGFLVMRVGIAEFIIEIAQASASFESLKVALTQYEYSVCPVARYDASWLLEGECVVDLLAELCMLDLPHETRGNQLCLTQLASINATVIQLQAQQFRIWCDGSYQTYMQEVFAQLNGLTNITENL